MSKHRSYRAHPSHLRTLKGHRGPRRPTPKRSKTALVAAIALVISGAAYSAHAKFAVGQSKKTVASDVYVETSAKHSSKPRGPRWTNWTTWRPTSSSPTTTAPTKTSNPTTAPTTSSQPTTPPTTRTSTTAPPSTTSATGGSTGGGWPGHIPGKFYLGMACGSSCSEKTAQLGGRNYGVHRTFRMWGEWSNMARTIQQDNRDGRLPWISVKPPGGGASGWSAIANGAYDAQIRQLASVLKANDQKPLLLTFHHEPSNDAPESQGTVWAAAYCQLHDVLEAQGALANVADPPIIGDWVFNPRNRTQDPANWLTRGVMQRMPFLGVDMYENPGNSDGFAVRIPYIINWMAARGFPNKMVGIGETGSTNGYTDTNGVTATQWLNASLAWAAANTDKVAVVSYYNTPRNSRSGVYWPLDETSSKLDTYRAWLDDSVTVD